MDLKECFTNSLKTVYANSSKSLNEFADELAISRSSLQGFLKGQCNPRIDTIQHVAKQLGMDPMSFLALGQNGKDSSGNPSAKALPVEYCPVHAFISRSLLALSRAERAEIRALFYRIISILALHDPRISRLSRSNDKKG